MQNSREYLFARAHTAEHAFIGALQNLLGQTLSVVKVNHREGNNTVIIKRIPEIDLGMITQAQENTNQLINTGRKIMSYTFSSLDEAKKQFPTLRANVERIVEPDHVRIIEIEKHDLAACSKDHVTNLKECDFFLVTRVSKSSDEVEIDFSVGLQAKQAAIRTSQKLLDICNVVGANINSIENTVRRLKNENENLLRNARQYSRKNLENIKPYTPEGTKITIFQGVFSDFIDSEIRAFADKKIVNNDTFVIIANAHNNENDLSNSTATLIVARSESLKDIDCNRIVKEISSMDGKGGGKPHFATGLIKTAQAANVVNTIVTLITM